MNGSNRSTQAPGGDRTGRESNAPSLTACALIAAGAFFSAAHAQPCVPALNSWPQLGGSATHISRVDHPFPPLFSTTWTVSADETGTPINFIPSTAIAATERSLGNAVVAVGRVSRPGGPVNEARVFCISRDGGGVIWSQPIPTPSLESWSSPIVDRCNLAVIVASNRFVTAFDLDSGAQRWQRQLSRVVVNATPVLTTDRGPADRVFITDFNGGGSSGRLYCINVDPFEAASNPYVPGEIVWSTVIGGTSGNTPAYAEGVVYVSTNGRYVPPPGTNEPGSIYAFPADATSEPAPLWVYSNVVEQGFYGGVSVAPARAPGQNPMVFAATYAFTDTGVLSSSNLVKVDGRTGELVWSVPCNRTSSMPVPLPDGRIVLSSGVRGDAFRSALSVAMYQDLGAVGQLLWESAVATWNDSNVNGRIDEGEYTAIGGWTLQPLVTQFAGRTVAALGVLPENALAHPQELLMLDLDRSPGDPAFITERVSGAGGTAALVGTSLYSIGEAGLIAFGPTVAQMDLNADSVFSIDDLYAWEIGEGWRDVDGNGAVEEADRDLLLVNLRRTVRSAVEGNW